MKNRKGILISMGIIAVTLISFYFDAQIVEAVSRMRTSYLDNFLLGLTSISSEIIVFVFLTILFLYFNKKNIIPLWITIFCSVGISFLLKIIVQRPRPFQQGIVSVLPVLEKASHEIWNFSFPSFHTMFIFCTIPIVVKQFPRFKYTWIAFAVLVAFSRIYFGVHFLSDIIVGGAIGYLIGWFVLKRKK